MLELKSRYVTENKNLLRENAKCQSGFLKIKFFVETWYFNRKIRFFDLIFEKLDFLIWKA